MCKLSTHKLIRINRLLSRAVLNKAKRLYWIEKTSISLPWILYLIVVLTPYYFSHTISTIFSHTNNIYSMFNEFFIEGNIKKFISLEVWTMWPVSLGCYECDKIVTGWYNGEISWILSFNFFKISTSLPNNLSCLPIRDRWMTLIATGFFSS